MLSHTSIILIALFLINTVTTQEESIRPSGGDAPRAGGYTEIPLQQIKALESEQNNPSFVEM